MDLDSIPPLESARVRKPKTLPNGCSDYSGPMPILKSPIFKAASKLVSYKPKPGKHLGFQDVKIRQLSDHGALSKIRLEPEPELLFHLSRRLGDPGGYLPNGPFKQKDQKASMPVGGPRRLVRSGSQGCQVLELARSQRPQDALLSWGQALPKPLTNPSAHPSAELPRKQLSLARRVFHYEDLPQPSTV